MTLEEAKAIQASVEAEGVMYFRSETSDVICLDGEYTVEQLEAAVVILKNEILLSASAPTD